MNSGENLTILVSSVKSGDYRPFLFFLWSNLSERNLITGFFNIFPKKVFESAAAKGPF